ncbi:MAG TPA: DUF2298 domain-containing protein, partial [Roseiflexaceae bacterium]
LLGNLAAAFQVGDSRGLGPVREALQGGLSGFGARLGDWFWGPSRVIYIPDKLITINEFPYWSFLFADLHPHLIALPIAVLMIALAYECFDDRRTTNDERRTTNEDDHLVKGGWSVIVGRWGLAALTLGALAVTNSWDFPTYTVLLGGALLGRAWREPSRRAMNAHRLSSLILHPSSLGARAISAIATTLLIAASALVLYLPFFQNFQAVVRGAGWVQEGTPLPLYVLIYGLALAILGPVVFAALWRLLGHRERLSRRPLADHLAEDAIPPVLGIVANASTHAALGRRLRRVLLITPALLLVISATQPALGLKLWLGALILVGLAVLLARRPSPAIWFAVWMAAVGWMVSLGMELIYIRDHLEGGDAYRMNTVFKFGFQVWVLLALAAAAALPWLARGLRRLGALVQGVGWAAFVALIALALVFPIVGTPSRLATRFPEYPGPTLDGLAFMDQATYDWNGHTIDLRPDGAAIRWLNEHIDGTPVVVQSSLEFYRAYGVRIAANTGLPTIVSPLHASEQHDPEQVAERDQDVQALYLTTDLDTALRLLSKYHVGYIYVGQIERAAYGEAGATKFDQMAGSYLAPVYNQDGVKIFQVSESVYSIAAQPIGAPSPPVGVQPQPAAAPPQPADGPPLETLERQVNDNPTVAGLAFGLGQRYYNLGRFDDAITVLNRAAAANPKDVPLHQLLGDVLRDAGRNDEAEAAYRAAADANPTAGNYNKLGVNLIKMGRLEQAEEAFLQAIAADPNVAAPFFHLGEIYEQQGQKDRAVEQYQQYLAIAPPDDQFRATATEAIAKLK